MATDPDIVRQMKAQLEIALHSMDYFVGIPAFDRVADLERQADQSILEELLEDPDGAVRCDAASAISKLFPDNAFDTIKRLLGDKEGYVREHICGLTYDLGDLRAAPDMVRVLQADSDPSVRSRAAFTLGKIGTLEEISALERAMLDDHEQDWAGWKVSQAAAKAIEEIQERVSTN